MKTLLTALLLLVRATSARAQPDIPFADFSISRSQVEDFGQTLGATETAAARPLNRLALEMIKDFEHWVATAYDDPAGYCTIGYGHLIALAPCAQTTLGDYARPLLVSAGADLLERDTTTARRAIQKLVLVELSDDQFGALTSFVFNVGKTNFQGSTLLKILNFGDYRKAANQLPRWVVSHGKVMNGLIERRACEAAMFRGDLALDRQRRFHRSACAALGAAPSVGPLIDIDKGE